MPSLLSRTAAALGIAATVSIIALDASQACEGYPVIHRNSYVDGAAINDGPFVDLPGAAVSKPASNPNCGLLHFSGAFAVLQAGNGVRIRVVINGRVAAEPPSVDIYPSAVARYEEHVAHFLMPNLADRARTVQIQFASIKGGQVYVKNHLTTLYYDGTPIAP